jgi:hypothetical protein
MSVMEYSAKKVASKFLLSRHLGRWIFKYVFEQIQSDFYGNEINLF